MPHPAYAQAMTLLQQRRKAEALAKFDEALAADPADAASLVERAYLVLESRNWAAAQAEMQKALEAAQRALGDLSAYRGRFWQAEETRPYLRALHGVGVCLLKQGGHSGAAQAFREVLALCPSDPVGSKFLLEDVRRKTGDAKPKGGRR